MKRFASVLLILCLWVSFASADSLIRDVNAYCSIFGVEPVNSYNIKKSGPYSYYNAGNCHIRLSDNDSDVLVRGSGEAFPIYCISVIAALEADAEAFVENSGLFFSTYLLVRSEGKKNGMTKSGKVYVLEKDKTDFVFIVLGK